MPVLSISVYAIMGPGDLDGPRPVLHFTDRAVAETVCAEMNAAGTSGPYHVKPITVWSGTPTQTAFYEMRAWLDRASGDYLDARHSPTLKEERLWPWDLEHYVPASGASPVPVGIYVRASGFERAAVIADFERLVASERARIAAAA